MIMPWPGSSLRCPPSRWRGFGLRSAYADNSHDRERIQWALAQLERAEGLAMVGGHRELYDSGLIPRHGGPGHERPTSTRSPNVTRTRCCQPSKLCCTNALLSI